jgi:hypothetical protein
VTKPIGKTKGIVPTRNRSIVLAASTGSSYAAWSEKSRPMYASYAFATTRMSP